MSKPRAPSNDDLTLAAEWLDANEGDPDESEPMRRVAFWLRELAYKRQMNSGARKLAHSMAISVPAARSLLAQRLNLHSPTK